MGVINVRLQLQKNMQKILVGMITCMIWRPCQMTIRTLRLFSLSPLVSPPFSTFVY